MLKCSMLCLPWIMLLQAVLAYGKVFNYYFLKG